jgi:phosphoribosylglycinamide formyltransferase-1
MVRIAIFASGNGSNAENIIRYFKNHPSIEVGLVVSNNPHAYVHERAKGLGIDSFTFTKAEFEDGYSVLELLKRYTIDFIVLAGFMLKIPHSLLDAFPDKIVNIHPALLPKYGGKGMYGDRVHRAVIESGETESGITIHYVNENYDEGDIIFQATCLLGPEDTYHEVAEKVHQLEYEFYPVVIEKIITRSSHLDDDAK